MENEPKVSRKTALCMLTLLRPTDDILYTFDYEDRYIFQLRQKGKKETSFDSTYSVNKNTGRVQVIQPFKMTHAENAKFLEASKNRTRCIN